MTVAENIIERGLSPQPFTHCHQHHHECNDCECHCKCDNYSKVDICELNTVLKDLDKRIADIKEYETLSYIPNKVYPKNSVVIFENKLYASKLETDSPPNTEFWKEVDLENQPKSYYNELPIGTVVTVPKDSEVFGFIDFVPGKEFSTTLFPDLYKALGSKLFPTYPGGVLEDSLPIGSMLHVLSKDNIPNGWVLFEHKPNSLANTELHSLLTKMTINLPNGLAKNVWDNALKQNTFPAFSKDFFLRVTQGMSVKHIGEMYEHSTLNLYDNAFGFPPVVNPPNDIRQDLATNVVSALTDPLTVTPSLTPTEVVLYGSTTEAYKTLTGKDVPPSTVLTVQSQRNMIGDEVAPYHMSVYCIVKASSLPRSLGGFKQVVKAFDVVDAPKETVVLEIQELLNTRLEFINEYELLTKKFENELLNIQNKIDDKIKLLNDLYNGVYNDYISKATDSLNEFKTELYNKLNEARIAYDLKVLELNNFITSKLDEIAKPYVGKVNDLNLKFNNLEPKVLKNTQDILDLKNKDLTQDNDISSLKDSLTALKSEVGKVNPNALSLEKSPEQEKFLFKETDTVPTIIYGKKWGEAILAAPDTWYTIVKDGKRYNLPLYLSFEETKRT